MFQTAIIERYRRRESSVEEILVVFFRVVVADYNMTRPDALSDCESGKKIIQPAGRYPEKTSAHSRSR